MTPTPLPTPTPTLAVISPLNAGQLTLQRELGRGRLLSVEWSPDGRYLGGHTVGKLAFTQDGRRLLMWDSTRELVEVWEMGAQPTD